jgi:hypothetical protein
MREIAICVALMLVAWGVGTGFSGAAVAVASRPTHCTGIPPSCHVGQIPICLCESQWWESCRWKCVGRP